MASGTNLSTASGKRWQASQKAPQRHRRPIATPPATAPVTRSSSLTRGASVVAVTVVLVVEVVVVVLSAHSGRQHACSAGLASAPAAVCSAGASGWRPRQLSFSEAQWQGVTSHRPRSLVQDPSSTSWFWPVSCGETMHKPNCRLRSLTRYGTPAVSTKRTSQRPLSSGSVHSPPPGEDPESGDLTSQEAVSYPLSAGRWCAKRQPACTTLNTPVVGRKNSRLYASVAL
mmetsp:Transcript_3382/g.9303  ORF Transcript_3382/g.9303 Transcript_3382/m.9303 type:complete len:229 (+) Transcript_3382:159-845(+)